MKTSTPKYARIYDYLKKGILEEAFPIGSYLPSEHEICDQFGTTRTTVRRALDELLKQGFIEKQQGKGTQVRERHKALGLLTVKGFSEIAQHTFRTDVLQEPEVRDWDAWIGFPLTKTELRSKSVYFQRLRHIDGRPIMLEHNWYAKKALPALRSADFVDHSFFKTLRRNHLIEILGSEQEIRAEKADARNAAHLHIREGDPILHISLRFQTSQDDLNIYSEVYCNTSEFPICNRYFL